VDRGIREPIAVHIRQTRLQLAVLVGGDRNASRVTVDGSIMDAVKDGK
jgi:hypothetical protein